MKATNLAIVRTMEKSTRGKMNTILESLAVDRPGTEIPKPHAKKPFTIKGLGTRRGEKALIYRIPSHSLKSKHYEKGITISEFSNAHNELVSSKEFSRQWFNKNMQLCAKEGACNFTTIGGLFEILGYAEYLERGLYTLTKE
jgi:hypothetical protein